MTAPSQAIDCTTRDEFLAYLAGLDAAGEYQFAYRETVPTLIASPGRFEGEPVAILYLYDLYLNGDTGICDFCDGVDGAIWYDFNDIPVPNDAALEESLSQILDFPTDLYTTCADLEHTPTLARYARLSNDSRGFWSVEYFSHDRGRIYMAIDERDFQSNDDDESEV